MEVIDMLKTYEITLYNYDTNDFTTFTIDTISEARARAWAELSCNKEQDVEAIKFLGYKR